MVDIALFEKGHTCCWKGKKLSQEHINKQIESRRNGKGWNMSEEHREKLRKSNIGKTAWNKKYPDYWNCYFCHTDFPNKNGHKRKFCSKNCLNKALRDERFMIGSKRTRFGSGSLHPNWKDERSKVHRNGKEFNKKEKEFIMKTQGNVCQMCFSTNSLEIDHIQPIMFYGEKSMKNAQVLCHTCHKKKTINEIRTQSEIIRMTKNIGIASVAWTI